MKKYYLLYCTVLYCTVLYCSIDVLGCDCCKKLCGKEKSWENGKKTKWKSLEIYNTQQLLPKAWNNFLNSKNANHGDYVPIILEQHDVKKGFALDADEVFILYQAGIDITLYMLYDKIFNDYNLTKLVFYINGDPDITYRGEYNDLGNSFLSHENSVFEKKSLSSVSEKFVFISYYAES